MEERLVDARPLRSLSDDELLKRLAGFVGQSRRTETDLIAHLAEVDERRLYAREASPSMFAYCTDVLHLSEHEAYLRITIARASRKHPRLLSMLADGRLHLSGAAELVPLLSGLSPQERDALLERATHKSKREIQGLVAELAPRPDARTLVRRLPGPAPTAPSALSVASLPPRESATQAASLPLPNPAPVLPEPLRTPEPPLAMPGLAVAAARPGMASSRPTLTPLAPSRYLVQFTASAELREKLNRLRSFRPDLDLPQLIEQAVTEKLERLEARRFGQTSTPRKSSPALDAEIPPSSRYIPAAVRREVYERDGGRCRFEDDAGRRCPATTNLEYHHHDRPFARGGGHTATNLRLLCHTHNTLLAVRDYGPEKMSRFRRDPESARAASSRGSSPAP